jgi:hypothetical protein
VTRTPWQGEDADAKAARIKSLLERMRGHSAPVTHPTPVEVVRPAGAMAPESGGSSEDVDYTVLTQKPNDDLMSQAELFDRVLADTCRIHLALAWPHIPPRAILPWMVREVSRGRQSPPLRTLFVNMGRPALPAVAAIEAWTARLRVRGVYRSGMEHGSPTTPRDIGADAHFYMFLGDTRDVLVKSVPLISIVPHCIAMNDGVFWRDFDEKTLKGFKRYFDFGRLQSIRRYLDLLTSASRSPGFAFLMPSHFDHSARRNAFALLPGAIDFIVIDMTTHAVRGRDPSDLLRDILSEIENGPAIAAPHVLITTDCPLRYSFLRNAAKHRRNPGALGCKVEGHRLRWASRGKGWDAVAAPAPCAPPIVITVASQECAVATRLWRHAQELDDANPLASILHDGAAALKGMALTASGADTLLAPYDDTHNAYHRIKRERHSFVPHYNKALAEIAVGRAGHLREAIQSDLNEALSLATTLRVDTPLLRYLRRTLNESARHDDILVVLRHPEDAQQANNHLLDYLTEPGRFAAGVPNLRVTTATLYYAEVTARLPTRVIWAASPISGSRAYIGDPIGPGEFHLIVAGQDAVTLDRILDVVIAAPEYEVYRPRVRQLKAALPRAPKDFGGITAALKLDVDRPRAALPFVGQGYLLLDGYGKVPAGAGTTFHVLDPVSQELAPHEARSIEPGDAVFVMPDAIREEIEAMLREKDDRGRTIEQSMVDQYKAIVRKGIDDLSRKQGKRITATQIREMLFESNPNLPPIGRQAVDYWLRAAERLDVDTPYAASDPAHFEAFLRLMGAGIMARPLVDAIRAVRSALQRDGHTNRVLFDRLLLDPDSLIHTRKVAFERLQGLRHEACENVFPVLERHLESGVSQPKSIVGRAATS